MSHAPSPTPTQVVICRDAFYEGYYDIYDTALQNPLPVDNLHGKNWPNTSNNESTDISSFKLGDKSTFTVYSEAHFGGTSQTFDRSVEDLRNIPVVIDGTGTNWNNKIKSFKLSSTK